MTGSQNKDRGRPFSTLVPRFFNGSIVSSNFMFLTIAAAAVVLVLWYFNRSRLYSNFVF
jgi:ABC-type Na+ efflux pump permease subunit